MASFGQVATRAAQAGQRVSRRRANQRAVARFCEFWAALQQVGDALAEASLIVKRAEDGTYKASRRRHWEISSAEEVRSALRACKFSLRICSAQAKRFEQHLVTKEWKR